MKNVLKQAILLAFSVGTLPILAQSSYLPEDQPIKIVCDLSTRVDVEKFVIGIDPMNALLTYTIEKNSVQPKQVWSGIVNGYNKSLKISKKLFVGTTIEATGSGGLTRVPQPVAVKIMFAEPTNIGEHLPKFFKLKSFLIEDLEQVNPIDATWCVSIN